MSFYSFYISGSRPPVIGFASNGKEYKVLGFDKLDNKGKEQVFDSIKRINKWPDHVEISARPQEWGFPTFEYYKGNIVEVPAPRVNVVPSPRRSALGISRISAEPIMRVPPVRLSPSSVVIPPSSVRLTPVSIPSSLTPLRVPVATPMLGKPSSAAKSSKEEVDYFDEPLEDLPPPRYIPKKRYPPASPPIFRTEREPGQYMER